MRILVVLALVLGLAACGSTSPPPVNEAVPCAAGAIKGQGSSAQTGAVNTWIRNYQVACADASIEYASTGSGAGQQAFIAGTGGDFVGSDSPFAAADQPRANAHCGSGPAIHLPMVVGPIALAYTVAGVGDLRLRPATVAKIFARTVTAWNDPAIAADNPGVTLPTTTIVPVHRLDSSGTTDNFTTYLAATAPGDWTFGHAKVWAAPGGLAETGNDGVSSAVARSDGAIGYVEWSYAQFHDLDTARVGNGADEFVALTADAAARTVASAKGTGTGGDLQLGIDYNTTARGAYPIVLVTYEIVCQKGTPAASLKLVRGFLSYTSSKAGQAAVTRLGYAPLPEQVRAKVATAVAALA